VEARLNMFVSGGTGSGKTTTLNVLSSFIPDDERIITIEDAAELQLRQRHVVTLEARPPNIEGRGAIPIRELVRNALHMRPDRIIVGECRSGEALDMLQAMNTGQDGSLSTGHANTPRDMLLRLETMVLMTGYELPLRAIREQIAASVDMIVHTARLKDGSRKIMTITEVLGMDGAEIITQDIFDFEQTGVQDGRVLGELKPTGVRPTFATKIKDRGVEVSADIYGPLLAATQDADAEAAAVSGPVAGYGEPVRAGGMVYLSGLGPVDPRTGRVVGMGLQEQAHQCLTNLKARLEQAGTTLDKVVWVTWVLRDADDIDTVLEEWARWLPEESPARQVSALPVIQRNGRYRVSVAVIAEA
jgi:enamine deaminase RidA (YjgF/YER057c/UK114 family)